MKVKELIEELEKCNPEAEILTIDNGGNILNEEGYPIEKLVDVRSKDTNIEGVYLVQN